MIASVHGFWLIVPALAAAAAVITLVLCSRAYPIAGRLGVMDVPDERKRHAVATPLMGGIVLLAVVVPLAIAAAMSGVSGLWRTRVVLWAAAVAAMAIVGIADDRNDSAAHHRLVWSFLVFALGAWIEPAFLVRWLAFEHPVFHLGLATGGIAMLFTTVCCVGLANAVNMADGKNGLVLGLTSGWTVALLFRAPPELVLPMCVLLAALLVLLLFNLRGRLFLGDGGSYGIATAIGLFAIMLYNTAGDHAGRAISAEELMVLFSVPVLDSFRLTYKRIRQGRSPMSPDRDHLHHILMERFGWPKALIVYYLVALLPAGLLWTLA